MLGAAQAGQTGIEPNRGKFTSNRGLVFDYAGPW